MSINTLNITKQWRDRRNVLLLLFVTCVAIPGNPGSQQTPRGFFFFCTPIRIDEIKAMSRGFTGGKQVKIICKCKRLRSSMFILDNRK